MSSQKYKRPGKRVLFPQENRILGLIFYNLYECENKFEQIKPDLFTNTYSWEEYIKCNDHAIPRFYVLWEFHKVVYECSYEQVLHILNNLIIPLIGQGQDIIITTTDVNNSDLYCFDHDGGFIIYKRM
jgi:hypothetical protein